MRYYLRRFLRVLIGFTTLFLLSAATLWLLATSSPGWYAPRFHPEAAALGETVEYRLTEEFQKIRPDNEPWTIRLREDQVNAWLVHRLPEWLAHDAGWTWPDNFGIPQLRFSVDGADCALPVAFEDLTLVCRLTLVPSVTDLGVHLLIRDPGLGRFRLQLLGQERIHALLSARSLPPELKGMNIRQVLGSVAGDVICESTWNLLDGRPIDVDAVRFGDGYMDLQCRTGYVPRPAGG